MGHRDDLLTGAKRCLVEKGYARTTARDIVAASGTNLASIGYHYGSKEALLNKALIEAVVESGDELGRAVAAEADADPGADPVGRFQAVWTRIIQEFSDHHELWAASLEIFGQVDRVPEIRQAYADAIQEGREGMAAMFRRMSPETGAESSPAVGSFLQALATGVMVQWLVDPERAPTGPELAEAFRTLLAWQRGAAAGEGPAPE
ncbi:TetR/AcrR family transcriptional regulator [Planomonospora sp. ID91781]|uniref:TetR family transcriptional regulator n=1 Tax=Planomonospora sphaerica TaxID=161355 RepID=A0A171DQC2_9ACTN|nr:MULTISPECIES: TetR/AcrR family transcriptional regulator [Planomonospora]MBG0824997.1 TetR/AcrR family transcriptional regulator [Planomonospora sp. ID91781]GAT71261.1 tetR family transcriptional regulator [Planomonospora sphaerica]